VPPTFELDIVEQEIIVATAIKTKNIFFIFFFIFSNLRNYIDFNRIGYRYSDEIKKSIPS
jgi:hypothetical protein